MKTLLSLIPREEERAWMLEMARRYRSAREAAVLDDVMRVIDRVWMPVRHPKPTRDEVAELFCDE